MELGTCDLDASCGDALKYFRENGPALFACGVNILRHHSFQGTDLLKALVVFGDLVSYFIALSTALISRSHT